MTRNVNVNEALVPDLKAVFHQAKYFLCLVPISSAQGSPEINGNIFFLMNMYIHICIIYACTIHCTCINNTYMNVHIH